MAALGARACARARRDARGVTAELTQPPGRDHRALRRRRSVAAPEPSANRSSSSPACRAPARPWSSRYLHHTPRSTASANCPTCRRSSPRNRGGASSCFHTGCTAMTARGLAAPGPSLPRTHRLLATGQAPRFTDKLPNNWQYVGAIRAMLPERAGHHLPSRSPGNLPGLLPAASGQQRIREHVCRSGGAMAQFRSDCQALAGAASAACLRKRLRGTGCRPANPHPRIAGVLRPGLRTCVPGIPQECTRRADTQRRTGP